MNEYRLWCWARALLGMHRARLGSALRDGDRGASAVELAVITAVILAIAIALLLVIKTFVSNQGTQITNQNVPGQ